MAFDDHGGGMVPDGMPGDGPAPAAAPDPVLLRSRQPMNDIGNAWRFHALAGGSAPRLLFCGEIGRQGAWIWFDGVRWAISEGDARARAVAIGVPDAIMEESRALRMADMAEIQAVYGPKFTRELADDRAAALYNWAMKSGNSDRTGGMLRQGQSLVCPLTGAFLMRAMLDQFDRDPYAINLTNGCLRFVLEADDEGIRRWVARFQPGHRPSDMFMHVAAVAYDPAAAAPKWRARLEELHDDPVARTMLQRIYGMCLTGLTSDQAFYIFQGKGGDGKSMTNKIIGALLGDYFRSASPKTFLQSRQERSGSEHQADIVRLRGDIRLVVIDEAKKGSTWDGERIKQVTGSRITARAPNAVEDLSFAVHWKLIAECNTLPKAPSDDRGFKRRYRMLPWQKSYGVTPGLADEPAHIVEVRLMAELSGILNWMIEGAIEWLESDTIPEPAVAKLATANFWAEGSRLGDWLGERCDTSDASASAGATLLYNDFKQWCVDRGDPQDSIITQTTFGKALSERQIYADKDKAGRVVRLGIRMREAWESGQAGDGPGVAGGIDDLPL